MVPLRNKKPLTASETAPPDRKGEGHGIQKDVDHYPGFDGERLVHFSVSDEELPQGISPSPVSPDVGRTAQAFLQKAVKVRFSFPFFFPNAGPQCLRVRITISERDEIETGQY